MVECFRPGDGVRRWRDQKDYLMSASACIVFYGIRRQIPTDAIEEVESRSDPLIEAARRTKLDVYWGNFGGQSERYYLFIGKKLGMFGTENALERSLSFDELKSIAASVSRHLTDAGICDEPFLYIQWEQDV